MFASKLAWTEIAVGLVAAAVAATASRVVVGERAARFTVRFRWLKECWRLPKYVLSGTVTVFAVLFRQVFLGRHPRSLTYAIPFDFGGDDPGEETRRALAVAYTTITPNFIVIGLDRERGLMFVYQLEETSVPEMTRRLGAKA